MATATYRVPGMSCEHCTRAVAEAVQEIPGVEDVSVELASGEVTVTSQAPLDPDQVRNQVEEAGYEVAT